MELGSGSGGHESHGHEDSHGHNSQAVWIGLMALSGIYGFFILERVVTIITLVKNKKKRQVVLPARVYTRLCTVPTTTFHLYPFLSVMFWMFSNFLMMIMYYTCSCLSHCSRLVVFEQCETVRMCLPKPIPTSGDLTSFNVILLACWYCNKPCSIRGKMLHF